MKKSDVNKLLARFDDSKRMVANLMARENITIQIVAGAKTASFDPVRRVLTIPDWSGLTLEQIEVLIIHEVGHAIWTDNTYARRILENPKLRGYASYFNIVEDARVERKMRESYPGTVKLFLIGYREFLKSGPILKGDRKGIFHPTTGVKSLFKEMSLINRINMHYKVGGFCDIPFSDAERVWLRRIDKCASMEDAAQIAKELHAAAKEKPEPEQPEQQKQKSQSKSKSKPEESDDETESTDSDEDDDAGDESDDDDASGDDESDDTDEDEDGESKGSKSDDDDEESDDEDDEDGSGSDDDEESDDEDEDDEDGSGSSDDDESDDEEDGSDGDDSDDDTDEDGDDTSDSDEAGDSEAGDDEDDDVADTAESIEEALKELAKQDDNRIKVRNVLCAPLTDETVRQRTVPAAQWADSTLKAIQTVLTNGAQELDAAESAWSAKYLATATHLATEFDRRKTAKEMQRATTGKTGRLDMNRLHAYRFTEDIFKRSTTLPNGKSHGVVMVIDGSGSMNDYKQFSHVMDQTLLFAHFAFKAGIPFEAYMFTSASSRGDEVYGYHSRMEYPAMGLLTLTLPSSGRLVGLINTTTDRAGFKKQVRAVLALRARYALDVDAKLRDACCYVPYSKLSSTPLLAGLMLAERHIERMKRTLHLDKTTLVVITDGDDTDGLMFEDQLIQPDGTIENQYVNAGLTPLVVRDTVTKRNFPLIASSDYDSELSLPKNALLTFFYDLVKARHDSRTVTLFIAPPISNYRSSPVVASLPYLVRAGKSVDELPTATIEETARKDHQYVLPKDVGVADLSMVLTPDILQLSEGAFANANTTYMSKDDIGKLFVQTMKKSVSNRVFVNTVVPYLA